MTERDISSKRYSYRLSEILAEFTDKKNQQFDAQVVRPPGTKKLIGKPTGRVIEPKKRYKRIKWNFDI